MLEAPIPADEAERLEALWRLSLLDTPPEQRLDRITRIAQQTFQTSIALVSLVDAERQWFKSRAGLDASETPRDISFCGHAILQSGIFYIPNALDDPRFADNPLVTGPPSIRLYAGAPLSSLDGYRLGTLCVIDDQPRRFTQEQLDTLRDMADMVQEEINNQHAAYATTLIRDKETFLRAILDNVADGILTVDGKGRIASASRVACELFGHEERTLIKLPLTRLVPTLHPEDYTQLQPDSGDKPGGVKVVRETGGLRADGTKMALEVVVTAMTLNDERRYIVVARDISDRIQAEHIKHEFVSAVSHELRTPLTSIRGALGLISGGAAGALTPKTREMVAIACDNSQRLVRLVNDILDLEKVHMGELVMDRQVLEFAPILRRAMEANRAYANTYQVTLKLEVQDERLSAEVDEDRLIQVLTNLIGNAAKFSPPGSTVCITLTRETGHIRVGVRDVGPGIPEAHRGLVFEKFHQVRIPQMHQKGGTGLGLSIAKALIEAMQGEIGFECPEAGGTEFYFLLPR